MGFVDLHAHVLPALDDGVKSVGEAVEVVSMLGRLGFETICCTPHQKVGSWVPSSDSISKARAEVVAALTTGAVGVELRLGAENFWDELFMQRCVEGGLPTYTGERAFLERLPRDVVGNEKKFGAERAHSFKFRFRRCFDRDDRARNARLSRSVRDALSCISRTDRPYTALALRIGEQRYRVRRTAQFVGINGLQVLQFKSNIGKIWSEL